MTSVLLVDDEPLVARLHARGLATAGLEATVAENGETALEQLQAHQPGLILTDMNMPDMTGIALARAARAQGYDGPIILLSGDDHLGLLIEGLAAGIDDFLVKGMPFRHLSQLVSFWTNGPMRHLPHHIREAVTHYFDLAWPIGPPIRQLHRDRPLLEDRAIVTARDLLWHAPERFGDSDADLVRLIGVADGILATLTRSDPLGRLRTPELLVRMLKLEPRALPLLAELDALARDATFLHAQETLRLS